MATSSSFFTWPALAMLSALDPLDFFSSSERTVPRNVTLPSFVTTFTFLAYVESALSCTIERRIFLE
jgi:hypothetical protein